MAFLEDFNDPDAVAERVDIRQCLRCTDAEAMTLWYLGQMAAGFRELADEVYAISLKEMDDGQGE